MPHSYSAAFSHLVLAGTATYCLYMLNWESFKCSPSLCLQWRCLSYSVIVLNSIVGIWRWGNPEHGDEISNVYSFTDFLQSTIVLPFIVTEAWIKYDYQRELAYLHCLSCILPITLRLNNKETKDIIDVIIVVNCTSLLVISNLHDSYPGAAAVGTYWYSHFFLKQLTFNTGDGEYPVEWYNYGLCFFCYFAYLMLVMEVGSEASQNGMQSGVQSGIKCGVSAIKAATCGWIA